MTTKDIHYDIDYGKLAMLLTPIVLRKPLLMSYIYLLVSTVKSASVVFRTFCTDKNYRIDHNGQVCYLRAVLNDQFDPASRRIRVEDVPQLEGNIIYMRETGRFAMIPMPPNARTINRRGFGGTDGYDFAVVLPEAMRGQVDENRMRAVVDIYRLAGKRFVIMYQNNNI